MEKIYNFIDKNDKNGLNEFLQKNKEYNNMLCEEYKMNIVSILIIRYKYILAEIFIKNGADINIIVSNNKNLFRFCLASNNFTGIKLLLKYKVNLCEDDSINNMKSNMYYLISKYFSIYTNDTENYRLIYIKDLFNMALTKYNINELKLIGELKLLIPNNKITDKHINFIKYIQKEHNIDLSEILDEY